MDEKNSEYGHFSRNVHAMLFKVHTLFHPMLFKVSIFGGIEWMHGKFYQGY